MISAFRMSVVLGVSFLMASSAMAVDVPAKPAVAPKAAAAQAKKAAAAAVTPAVESPAPQVEGEAVVPQDVKKAVDQGKEVPGVVVAPEKEVPPLPYGKTHPLLGPVQFGPKLNLVVLPALGLEARAFNYVSASFDYLLIPSITVSGISAGSNMWWLGLRGHPFRGSFFLGADLYNIRVTGSKDVTFNLFGGLSETRNIAMTASVMGVAPMLGWRWVTHSGFFAGLELGALVTFASGLDPTVERKATDSSLQVAGETFDLSQAITTQEDELRTALTPFADLAKQYIVPHFRFSIGFLF